MTPARTATLSIAQDLFKIFKPSIMGLRSRRHLLLHLDWLVSPTLIFHFPLSSPIWPSGAFSPSFLLSMIRHTTQTLGDRIHW